MLDTRLERRINYTVQRGPSDVATGKSESETSIQMQYTRLVSVQIVQNQNCSL